jgi:hypothetical protein
VWFRQQRGADRSHVVNIYARCEAYNNAQPRLRRPELRGIGKKLQRWLDPSAGFIGTTHYSLGVNEVEAVNRCAICSLQLSLSSNPGPRAGGEKGSGFLSAQNDDASAERLLQVYASAGLANDHVVPKNAFPSYVHDRMPDGLSLGHIEEGVHALHRLLELCPDVVSIVAHGGDAHRSAQMLPST